MGFPCVTVVKNLHANAGDTRDVGLISGSGRSPGEGNGNSLQYSCLENPMDRGAWRAMVLTVRESQTQLKQLRMHAELINNVVLVSELCPTLCNPMDCSPPGSSVHGIFQQQYIFPTQGSNPHLLHWQADSLPLYQLESPSDPKLSSK